MALDRKGNEIIYGQWDENGDPLGTIEQQRAALRYRNPGNYDPKTGLPYERKSAPAPQQIDPQYWEAHRAETMRRMGDAGAYKNFDMSKYSDAQLARLYDQSRGRSSRRANRAIERENGGFNPNLAFDDQGFTGLPRGVNPNYPGNPFGRGNDGRGSNPRNPSTTHPGSRGLPFDFNWRQALQQAQQGGQGPLQTGGENNVPGKPGDVVRPPGMQIPDVPHYQQAPVPTPGITGGGGGGTPQGNSAATANMGPLGQFRQAMGGQIPPWLQNIAQNYGSQRPGTMVPPGSASPPSMPFQMGGGMGGGMGSQRAQAAALRR